MSTHSSSTQLCPQQLDEILGPDLEQFEKLIYLISKDEDQVSPSKALFDQALRSRPDSLLLALSQLLSSDLPNLRAAAAKHLGEIFATFFSSNLLKETTLDSLKSDLLSASRNQVLVSDVRNRRNPLLRTISDFHATGSWPELLPYLFECVDSESHDLQLQGYALWVFKSLAENSNGNAALIPRLETFRKIFEKCLCSSSSWEVRIAALNASISFVQFIPNRNDPNRFEYLCLLMIKTLTGALNSGSEYETEETLHLLIKLAKADPRFFKSQLRIVLTLMLKIAFTVGAVGGTISEMQIWIEPELRLNTLDDSLDVKIRSLAIKFLMTFVKKAPSMISKEPRIIMGLFKGLMYMLLDFECVDADAAIVAATDDLVVTSSDDGAADNDDDGDGDGDEVFESTNYKLGKKYLRKLSILLSEKKIFQEVLLIFERWSGTSIWKQRHAVFIAFPEIAKGCYKVMLEDLDWIRFMFVVSLNDSHPRVCLATINGIKQLSVDFGSELLTKYPSCLIKLIGVMNDPRRRKLQAPATSAVLCLVRNCTEEFKNRYMGSIMEEFCKFVVSHFPNLLEKSAVRMLSHNIDQLLRQPLVSPEYLSSLLDSDPYMLGRSEATELKRLIMKISSQ